MFACHIDCYPWDLLDEGIEAVLDLLLDRAGATGITVVITSDETEQFRPHAGAEPRIYRTAGGVYFHPNPDCYQATRLKPPLWDQHRKLDALARISELSASRKMDLRLLLRPFVSARLVSKHPECACKNLFGESSRRALCPANPDVQEYLLSLVRDLSVYDDVSAIIIDGACSAGATDPKPRRAAQVLFGDPTADLLNVCFSESALQAANRDDLDAQAALRSARVFWKKWAADQSSDKAKIRDPDTPLARYRKWHQDQVFDLFQRMSRTSGKPLGINLRSAVAGMSDHLRFADKLIMPLEALRELSSDAAGPVLEHVALSIDLSRQDVRNAQEVVRQISWAGESGVQGVCVQHYGIMLQTQLDWIHQGLRNARRL